MIIKNSERLTYRLMGQDDAKALWELDQDPEVMHFLNGGKPNSMDDIKNTFMPRMAKFTNSLKGWGIWQVSNIDNNEYLGWVLARPMDFFTETPKFDDIELGWRFFRKTWGKGYATEAAITVKNALVLQASTEEDGINFISALAVEDNIASTKVMEKVGMCLLRKYRHLDPIGDFDAVHYQMPVEL